MLARRNGAGRRDADAALGVAFNLPWPVSANQRLMPARGRWTQAIRYRRAMELTVAAILLQPRPGRPMTGSLELEIVAMPPNRRIVDLSNLIKLPEDALVKARVIADDSLFTRVAVELGDIVPGGRLCVTVSTR